jgi:hypothetical protein
MSIRYPGSLIVAEFKSEFYRILDKYRRPRRHDRRGESLLLHQPVGRAA